MKTEFTEREIRSLEEQLSCPSGDLGIEVGRRMMDSNAGMIINSMMYLELFPNAVLCELGHGNGGHFSELVERFEGITYYGLEVSKTMFEEAQKNIPNDHFLLNLYAGKQIPFEDSYFDFLVSVNTLYFWEEPRKLTQEIARVLKPNGVAVLSYIKADFMRTLPFVGDKFQLYDLERIRSMIKDLGLYIDQVSDQKEDVLNKMNQKVSREYSMVRLVKT